MGKVAMQTGRLQNEGIEYAYRLIKEAGFDAVDANIDGLYPPYTVVNQTAIADAFRPDLSEAECLAYFKPYKDAAKEYGLENYQAHAFFPTMIQDKDAPEHNAVLLECLKKTVRAADYIDCRNLVIHPFFRNFKAMVSPEEEWQKNIDSYSALIPTAKEYGVKLNLENMFRRNEEGIHEAICGDPEEAVRYIDTLNGIAGENIFGFCLDTGHINLCGRNIKDVMAVLGDRINCFHVHDNDGIDDQHYVPYWGKADWEGFVEGLKALNYNGVLSCEGGETWKRVPKELWPQMLRYTADAMRLLTERAGK